jgi:pilus assembly protein FimV
MPLESDALGEAEVYLAYGRYDQARQVVGKALEQEPQRADLHLKLMEIMALTHDADGFENQARLLHEQVGADDPSWQRAQEMGREFLPSSPLFGQEDEFEVDALPVAEADEPAAPESNELDFGEFAFDKKSSVLDEAPEPAAEAQGAAEFSTDFDLDLTAAEPAPVENDLDFALDEPAAAAQVESEDALDFGLDEPGGLAQEPAANVIEFTLPEDEANEQSLEELDEADTKLDLARAYLDMGDSEGARSLLDEVLSEGSAMQKRQAEDLLREIA